MTDDFSIAMKVLKYYAVCFTPVINSQPYLYSLYASWNQLSSREDVSLSSLFALLNLQHSQSNRFSLQIF